MIDLTQLIHPIAILDIAIVAILIYKIISMVRGTRAEQLLKGIALLLVLNVLCRFLRLTTVTWILDQVQTLLLIAIPVVFQPELRKFLEQLGNSTLIPGNRKNREDEEDTDTCQSHLQAHRQSHLLALEPLGDGLGNSDAGHLAAAAEYHKSERRHLCAARKSCPPRSEPLAECSSLEPVRDTDIFDAGSDNHQRSRKNTCEPHAHLVKDDAGKDKEAEDIQHIFRSRVCSEHRAVPAS